MTVSAEPGQAALTIPQCASNVTIRVAKQAVGNLCKYKKESYVTKQGYSSGERGEGEQRKCEDDNCIDTTCLSPGMVYQQSGCTRHGLIGMCSTALNALFQG